MAFFAVSAACLLSTGMKYWTHHGRSRTKKCQVNMGRPCRTPRVWGGVLSQHKVHCITAVTRGLHATQSSALHGNDIGTAAVLLLQVTVNWFNLKLFKHNS
jgi:hypothetical protein